MVDVFLCHAPADRAIASQIAARLERGSEAAVWLDPCGRDAPQSIAAAWDGGLSSTAILLLLSPNSVPDSLPMVEWQPLLKHLEGNTAPGVGAIFLDPCPFPKLLERKRFYRWSDGPNDVARKIERWLIGLHRDGEPSCAPAPLPGFKGREKELQDLWSNLADASHTVILLNEQPRSGKSALAQEFARTAGSHFRDVVWVGCGNRTPVAISGELRNFSVRHRQLLVLDDLATDFPAEAGGQGNASILVTTRRRDLNFPPHARIIEIASIDSRAPEAALDTGEARLLEAMSACRPQAVPLELARRIAGFDGSQASEIVGGLTLRRWIDPVESTATYYRLVYGRTPSESVRTRHALALHEAFSSWRKQPALCSTILGELEAGFDWALVSDWPLATRLAAHAFAYLRSEERLPEAVQLYTRLRDAARERNDAETVKNCSGELSWISDDRGCTRSLYVSTDQLALNFT